jgi:hypothetical protein
VHVKNDAIYPKATEVGRRLIIASRSISPGPTKISQTGNSRYQVISLAEVGAPAMGYGCTRSTRTGTVEYWNANWCTLSMMT